MTDPELIAWADQNNLGIFFRVEQHQVTIGDMREFYNGILEAVLNAAELW